MKGILQFPTSYWSVKSSREEDILKATSTVIHGVLSSITYLHHQVFIKMRNTAIYQMAGMIYGLPFASVLRNYQQSLGVDGCVIINHRTTIN